MDRIEEKIIESKLIIHHFSCDECGKDLGSTEEYEDGYYPKVGCYGQSFHLEPGGWFRYSATLCDECKEKKTATIKNSLLALGFRAENIEEDDIHD